MRPVPVRRSAAIAAASVDLDRQHHVGQHRPPRQQGRALEHERHVPARPGDGITRHPDRAGRRPEESRDQPEQGGLATPRPADQRDELAVADVQVDLLEGSDLALASVEDLPHIVQLDHLAGLTPSARGSA
jgi:hypothetical protein